MPLLDNDNILLGRKSWEQDKAMWLKPINNYELNIWWVKWVKGSQNQAFLHKLQYHSLYKVWNPLLLSLFLVLWKAWPLLQRPPLAEPRTEREDATWTRHCTVCITLRHCRWAAPQHSLHLDPTGTKLVFKAIISLHLKHSLCTQLTQEGSVVLRKSI